MMVKGGASVTRCGVVLTAVVVLAGCGFRGGPAPSIAPLGNSDVPASGGVPQYLVLPLGDVSAAELRRAHAAGKTIPYFEGHVRSPLDQKTYAFRIVGKAPGTDDARSSIPYVAIFVAIRYPDGTLLSPTEPACGDDVSVEQRFLGGPNFTPTRMTSNGIDIGTVQFGDAFQRAEFWKSVKRAPNYHTVLRAATDPVVVYVNAPASSKTTRGVCAGAGHRTGTIPIADFAAMVGRLVKKHAPTTAIAIVVAYNTFEIGPKGNCCIVGFHGAFKRGGGVQSFASAAYNDAGSIRYYDQIADINATTHELGEVFNDPFPLPNGHANMSPAWGHVGQYVYGCSTYFEVGDPLDATGFPLRRGGFTYHPQELAFFSWFYRTKSSGTGGKYSFNGTFTKAQGPCK
ncbi:MAG: hypothetical protein JO030_02435 [Candidatus Eremiobacteraeota bacterium]|nr:hypothetical protein [Candidatus Eremiobacteraeota bacterium]